MHPLLTSVPFNSSLPLAISPSKRISFSANGSGERAAVGR